MVQFEIWVNIIFMTKSNTAYSVAPPDLKPQIIWFDGSSIIELFILLGFIRPEPNLDTKTK